MRTLTKQELSTLHVKEDVGDMETLLLAIYPLLSRMTGPLYTDSDIVSLTASQISPSRSNLPGKDRILLLEDDPFFGRFLREWLRRQDFNVELFTNGESGLCAISQRDYDFVICDMDLEGINGIDIYRNLATTRPAMCDRFIFISGNPYDQRINNFILTIQGRILYKPFRIEELISYLE